MYVKHMGFSELKSKETFHVIDFVYIYIFRFPHNI